MSRFMLSVGLLLGSLAGLAGAGEPTAVAHSEQTAEASGLAKDLVYGPYSLDVARGVAGRLEVQGYEVMLVQVPEGHMVYAN